jgi:hypothetical protein
MVRQRVAPWLRTRADSDELRKYADRGSTSLPVNVGRAR